MDSTYNQYQRMLNNFSGTEASVGALKDQIYQRELGPLNALNQLKNIDFSSQIAAFGRAKDIFGSFASVGDGTLTTIGTFAGAKKLRGLIKGMKNKGVEEGGKETEGPEEKANDAADADTEVRGYDPATDPENIRNPIDSDDYRFTGTRATEEPDVDTFRATLDPEEQDLYDRLNDLDLGDTRRMMNQRVSADTPEAPEVPESSGPQNIELQTFKDNSPEPTGEGLDDISEARGVRTDPGRLGPELRETDLAPTETEVPDTELGAGRITTGEPAGRGSGDIELTGEGGLDMTEEGELPFTGTGMTRPGGTVEMQTFKTNVTEDPSLQQNIFEDATEDVAKESGTIADKAGDIASKAAGGLEDLASGAGEAADAAIETGVEAAGGILDAIPVVGEIAGAILGIGGAIFGAVEDANTANVEDEEEESQKDMISKTAELKQEAYNRTFGAASFTPTLTSLTQMPSNSGVF